jgi:hypothetical protein
LDTGNERDDQAGTEDSTYAWSPESDDAGWGAPAGSSGDPGNPRRRPVLRSPRSGWDQGPADWSESGSDGDQWDDDFVQGGQPGGGPGGYAGGAPNTDWSSGLNDGGWPGSQSGGSYWRGTRGDTAQGRSQPSPVDDPYAADDEYGATRRSDPSRNPEVWGTSSYETVVTYPPGDYGEPTTQRRSHFQPPIFPSDPDVEPAMGAPRRRTGKIAVAAVGALVLLGGGVAAAVTLGGSKNPPAATAGGPTSLAGSAQNNTSATTLPTTSAPQNAVSTTTTPAPTTASTTPPTSAAANNLPLGAWTTQELNLILQIKGDLTSLNRDLDPQPNFNALTVDAANLSQDLQAAQSSPTPDNANVAQEWGQLIQDMGTSNNDLNGAIGSHDPNVAQDLEGPVSATDHDYNNLSQTLNEATRHADSVTGGGGRSDH